MEIAPMGASAESRVHFGCSGRGVEVLQRTVWALQVTLWVLQGTFWVLCVGV